MPRPVDYYDSQNQGNLKVQDQPVYQSPLMTPPAPTDSGGGINSPQNVAATQRGFWSFFGQGVREIFTGRQDNWDQLSAAEKAGIVAKGTGKLGLDVVTSLPKTVVKAPIGVGMSIMEGVDQTSQKLFGTKQFVPEKIDLTGVFGDNAVTRYFGDVTGVRASYQEAKQMAGDGPWSNFVAGVVATGKLSGDVAISASLVNSIRGAFKPSLATVEKPVIGEDFRPQTPTQISQIKMRINETTGGKIFKNPVVAFEQNSNATFMRLPANAAEQYGGNVNNTFLRIAPAGGNTAEFSVVQIKPSLMDQVSNFFGKGQIIKTEMGPAVKLDTGLVKYNPQAITQAGDALPDFLQPTAAAETTLPAAAVPAVPGATVQAMPNLKTQQATTGAAMETGTQIPSVMQRPLKGFENAPLDSKQMGQINALANSRGIDDKTINVIATALTGKSSLADLTQKDAFKISETLRMFGQPTPTTPAAGDMFWRPFTQPARYWMEAAQRELNVPAYSGVYIPMETGSRLSKVFETNLKDQAREIFGPYADPAKFVEERRLLTSYIEGNTSVITNNPALTPEVKADLTRIGDWLSNQFKNFFEQKGIASTKYYGKYAPNIRQLGTIFNLYKTGDVPPELQPFFSFERQGMDVPKEDDALVLYDIYSRAFARDSFLREPLNQAKAAVEKMPPNLKKSVNDYLQEKLGYQGEIEKSLNDWGSKLSIKTNGAVPPDIFRRTIDFLMTNAYAATLGIPRLAPIIANGLQTFVTTYPELGDKYFAVGIKRALSKDGFQPLRDRGFLVEKGFVYGGELASAATTGKFGQAVKKYEDLNRLSLKPFSSVDNLNRAITYHGVVARFEDNWNAFLDGKLTYDQFEKNISMDGFNPTLQGILREKFAQNTPEALSQAQDLMAQDIMDSTQFPYRKGAETRLHYGLKGKFGLQYTQWPWEYAHTLKSWIARGQWDKLLRWYAMGAAIGRSFKEAFGIDVSRYILLGPVANFPVGPLANAAVEFGKSITAASQDLAQEADNSWKEVTNALRNYGGVPFGIGAQRLKAFYRSVHRMEAGLSVSTDPDPLKRFGIYSTTGKIKQWVTFSDLLKYTIGFTPESFSTFSDNTNQIKKDTLRYNDKVDEAMNALVDGDFKKFDQIITKNNLVIGDVQAKLQSYQIPLDQRLWSRMPETLKEKYIHVFFPTQ